jgi:transposase
VSPEALVPADHPLREIRKLTNAALERLSGEFDRLYACGGRDSIAPEKLLRALLLQAFYSARSERRLMEQLTYNMLFRWFVGLSMDAPVWDVTVFTKNRDRLLRGDIAQAFFRAVLADPQVRPLLSSEHFTVDGTLIEAWASMKSFRPKDGSGEPPTPGRNGERDFHKEKRSNETHASTTDPDARLARKSNGQAAKMCYAGHVVMENRSGLVVSAMATLATGTAERDAAQAMMARLRREHRSTLGADKNYDTRDFVAAIRGLCVTPHVAQHQSGRRSAIDGRTTRHLGYVVSQRIRKRVETVFGWGKEIGGMRRMPFRGLARMNWAFTLRVAACNLVRLPKLLGAAA